MKNVIEKERLVELEEAEQVQFFDWLESQLFHILLPRSSKFPR